MKNINLQKILRYLWNFFRSICFIIGLGTIVGLGYIVFLLMDNEGRCLSEGYGVWDADKHECRQDCLTWRKDLGCVPITEENIRKKEKGKL